MKIKIFLFLINIIKKLQKNVEKMTVLCYNLNSKGKRFINMKEIAIFSDYITLGQFLKYVGIIDSGALAKAFLAENTVFVNGEPENRRGRKLYADYIIEFEGKKYKVTK